MMGLILMFFKKQVFGLLSAIYAIISKEYKCYFIVMEKELKR